MSPPVATTVELLSISLSIVFCTPLIETLAPTATLPPLTAPPTAAVAILPSGKPAFSVDSASRETLPAVTVDPVTIALMSSATSFQDRPTPKALDCVPMPKAPAIDWMTLLSSAVSETAPVAVTLALLIVAVTDSDGFDGKMPLAVEMMLMPMALMIALLSAVAVNPPICRLDVESLPSTPASVGTAIWLKPIDPPTPVPPRVNAAPPPIAIMLASFSASSTTSLLSLTVALSIVALVVSRMRLTDIEPAKSLPFALVSAARAAVSATSMPSRCAVSERVVVPGAAAPVMSIVPPLAKDSVSSLIWFHAKAPPISVWLEFLLLTAIATPPLASASVWLFVAAPFFARFRADMFWRMPEGKMRNVPMIRFNG
jgi:hypothetical protein